MATELLERAVIPYFDEEGITYSVPRDDVVQTDLPTSHGVFRVWLYDNEFTIPPALSIIFIAFAGFPPNQKSRAESMCNTLNTLAPGKYTIDNDMHLNYEVFWPIMENTTSDKLRTMLSIAIRSFEEGCPLVMKVRWTDLTVEQALQIPRDEGSSSLRTLMRDVLNAIEQDDEDESDGEEK